MSGAAQAGLDFIRYQQHPFAAANGGGVANESFGRNQDAGFALDRFKQKRAGVRRNGALKRFRVAERNGDETRCERSEAVLVKRFGGKSRNRGGASVKIVLANNNFGLIQRDALARVPPTSASFNRGLHGLGARVHREHHLHATSLRKLGDKVRELIVAESARGKRNPLRLFFQCLDDTWMAVALVHC